MERSLVTIQEIDNSEKDGRPASSVSVFRHSSSSSHSKPSSARHSYEAPASPFRFTHNNNSATSASPHHDSASVPASDNSRNATFDPDPPPSYKEDELRRKMSVDEEIQIRKWEYAIWLSRTMGKQLVKGLNRKERAAGASRWRDSE